MTPPLTPDHLAELRRLAGEATAGPWHLAEPREIDHWDDGNEFPVLGGNELGCVMPSDADAAYIVALVNAAPALIEAAQREDRLRAALDTIVDACARTTGGRYVGRTVDFDAAVHEAVGVLAALRPHPTDTEPSGS